MMRPALVVVCAAAALACAGCAPAPGGDGGVASTASATSTTAPVASSTTAAAATTAPATPTTTVAAALPAGDSATVERVVDGDTIVLAGGERVRLIGVDTPETKDPRKAVQCFGAEASAHTVALLPPGTAVRVVYDVERHDRYRRTLAYVYRESDGLFVNADLVANGYAQILTIPPNVTFVDEFRALQTEARDANRGLWGGCP